MTLPENTRLLRTGELPTVGTLVYVPANTEGVVGQPPTPGWWAVQAADEDDNTVAVETKNGLIAWVLSHNLLVEDKTRRPAVGDRVTIDAPGEKYHGQTGTLAEDDGTNLPYFVRFKNAGAEWFTPNQITLVPDEADTALVSVRHETTVILQRPVTAGQLAAGAAAIDPDWPVIVNVHPDRIEIHGHHEETSG